MLLVVLVETTRGRTLLNFNQPLRLKRLSQIKIRWVNVILRPA